VDSAWEQRKLEARKMLINAAEFPASSARFVGRVLPIRYCVENSLRLNYEVLFTDKMILSNQNPNCHERIVASSLPKLFSKYLHF